jgi:hypothetical protein
MSGLESEPSHSISVAAGVPEDADEQYRYPIGRFQPARFDPARSGPPSQLSAAVRDQLIDNLSRVPEQLAAAVAGLDAAQLDTPYRPGGWTVRQLVHHLADSHANAYIRIRLALTEDWPTIKPYDEAAWAELADSAMPVGVSLDLLTALHARWVALLRPLGEDHFSRGYTHPQLGRQTLAQVLALYDWHSRHHLAHIHHLAARQGWRTLA